MTAAGTATITQRLSEHVVGLRFRDISPDAVAKTKDLLIHHIASALRGRSTTSGRQAIGIARELSPTGGQCTIIGQNFGANLLDAVLANSSLMASAGTADFLLPPGINPGVAAQPVAWAVGEITRSTGRELLAAVAIGYDVMAKLHGTVWTWDLDVPRPLKFVIEPFGAAATAARLLGLTVEQTVWALGHAGQAGMGVYEGSEYLSFMHPLAARNGIMAATLAKAGVPASSTIIEGRHGVHRTFFLEDVPDALYDGLATLGQEFEISRAQANRSATSVLNVIPVALAQQLVAEHQLSADHIASIQLTLPAERRSREKAYYSYSHRGPRYLLAIIVTGGQINVTRFDEAAGPDVLAMAAKISLRFEDGHSIYYARVDVNTTDGQRYSAEGDRHDQSPLSWEEQLGGAGADLLSGVKLRRLADQLRHLEDVDDISEVMACLRPGESAPTGGHTI
ncbi:MmgE/PrpD family protein [Kribbella shirazensis]|uniref:2-methylcitrate dehydratase PrpD n=1 Tax=Kribbella shirazensis TaxID=1105143 RepID=A0A7X5VHQ2_9ACTN|nr:MmgE/PrpD family protein [Kribbella shirazensis]NIK61420.1 2-methylcitrate dehydratase PrpD [Kribbella shirazensis]